MMSGAEGMETEIEIAQIKSSTGGEEGESSEVKSTSEPEVTPEVPKEGSQSPALGGGAKGGERGEGEEEEEDSDDELDPRKQQWSESLKARLFGSADKDGNFFSYMFLDKIFGESRPCIHCGARGSAKLPPGDNSLQLFVIEQGIIGKQNIMCEKCDGRELVISGDDPSLMPQDLRLAIKGLEIRDYCRKITHYEVLHDLMEMLHIAAMDDNVSRKERHSDVAAFMLHNAKKICEEWCRPEHAELRLKKYLRLREETLLTKYEPTFTPDHTEEYREMYEMMAQSFRQNRSQIVILLSLMKESLFDSPSRSNFMMWVSIAMMHSENYPQFKRIYDPRSFMRVESSEYQAMRDRYLSLDVPLGIKKIPIIFVLFEIPRFYHYVDFLNTRLGKRKPRSFLSDADREELKAIDEETSKMGMGRAARRRAKKTKTMVSPEAHLDFLTQQEEMDRERVYQSCRDKKAAKSATDMLEQDHSKESRKATPKPLPICHAPTSQGDGVKEGEEKEKPALTKAQLKRRKKKAAQKAGMGEGSPPEGGMAKAKEGMASEPASGSSSKAEREKSDRIASEAVTGTSQVEKDVVVSKTLAEKDVSDKVSSKAAASKVRREEIDEVSKTKVGIDEVSKAVPSNVDKDASDSVVSKTGSGEDVKEVGGAVSATTDGRGKPEEAAKEEEKTDTPSLSVAESAEPTPAVSMATPTDPPTTSSSGFAVGGIVRPTGNTLPQVPTEDMPPLSYRKSVDALQQLVRELGEYSDSEDDPSRPQRRSLTSSSIRTLLPSLEGLRPEDVMNVTRTPPELVYAARMVAEGPRNFPEWEKPEVVKAEIKKTADILWQVVKEYPDHLNLEFVDKKEFLKDLCTLSYPIVADLLESVNSLAEPLTSMDLDPSLPKMVSVMVDPLVIYKEDEDPPETGAIVFVKRKNKVRGLQPRPDFPEKHIRDPIPESTSMVNPKGEPSSLYGPLDKDDAPPDKRSSNVLARLAAISQTDYTGREKVEVRQQVREQLMELMVQAMVEMDAEDEEAATLDYNFLSIESTHLPPTVRALVEKGHARGEEFETVVIGRKDYLDMIKTVQAVGVPHDKVRHHDTESIVCFPSEFQMDNCMLDPEHAYSLGLFDRTEEVGIDAGPVQRCLEPPPPPVPQKPQASAPKPPPTKTSFAEEEMTEEEAKFFQSDVPLPSVAVLEKLIEAAASSKEAKKEKAAKRQALEPPKDPTPPTKRDRNVSRRAKREAIKTAKKTLKNPGDHQAIMVTQMDTELLRRQGFKVESKADKATVVANKDGAIIHVLDGPQTPTQVRDFLAKRYNLVAQQTGPGYITMPTKDHPGGLLVDPKLASREDVPRDKFAGNRKKLRSKKKAIQEQQYSSLTRWPVPRPKNPYSERLGLWAQENGPWPEGLDYGTEYHSDREILCESDDENLVKAIDKDEFGNHSMLMRLELSTVDVPNEKAAETVMNRYMEPADLGPGIDPKVPRYIIPSGQVPSTPSKKLPAGTTAADVPFIMKYAAPHRQMRALDAMRIPYKYELTQLLTPHLNEEGEEVPEEPKRRALLSKLTLLPRSRYRSLNPEPEDGKEDKEEEEKQEDEAKDDAPKISKAKRKKMKKKMKQLAGSGQDQEEPATPIASLPTATTVTVEEPMAMAADEDTPMLDVGMEVRTQPDHAPTEPSLPLSSQEPTHETNRGGVVPMEGNPLKPHPPPPTTAKKPKYCDNCGNELLSRIQVCAGCKKVAYCNFRCQKASWKVHKKTCSYALRKDGKESTG